MVSSPKNVRAKLLKEAITTSKEVSLICFILRRLTDEHSDPASRPLITDMKELDEFKIMIIEKISTAASESRLLEKPFLPSILLQWKEQDENAEIESWMNQILLDDSKLIKFLSHFLTKEFEMNPFSHFSNTKYSFNLKSLKSLIDPDQVIQQVRDIKKQNCLDEKGSSLIDKFIESYEKQ